MAEKITIQPGKIRAYGNIVNNKTVEDYDRYESSLVKSLVTINGVPIQSYLLVYSPNNFAFDFDGNLKHLYVSEDEETVEGFTFDNTNKRLSFTSDDVSFGFDDTNKRLYCDNEYHPTSYTVSLNVSSSTVSVGGSVTLSATVLDDQETAVEGATVTFKVGGSTIDTATTNSSGVATLSYTCNTAGSLSFTASCNGANSSSQSVTVNKLSTSTALTSSGSSVTVGTSVTLTATVTSGGSGVNGLTVTFKDGTSTLGTGTTNSSGVATYTYTALSVGSHTLEASFGGDTTYASSNASTNVTVLDHAYTLAFDSANYTTSDGNVTAYVTLQDNGVVVSGASVSLSGTGISQTATTNSSGVATFSLTGISQDLTLTASYNGASATATVTYQSGPTYLFYDACDSSSGLTNYANSISLRNNGTSTITYDSTENAYKITCTKSSSQSIIPIIPLEGYTGSFKITFESRCVGTMSTPTGLGVYNDDNNWYVVAEARDRIWFNQKVNGTESHTGQSAHSVSGVIQVVITVDNTNHTMNIKTYQNGSIITNGDYTLNIGQVSSNTIYGLDMTWNLNDYVYIYDIKAEPL